MTTSRSRTIALAMLILTLTAVAIWQNSRAIPTPRAIDWTGIPRRDLVTAALFLDVQEGGPGLALRHLADLAARDAGIRKLGHGYAHDVGRYALRWQEWDPHVYAQCTPEFYAGCYHGLIEAYVHHITSLDSSELSRLCDQIVGSVTAQVARRECAHGLGHGLWFRLHGGYTEALTYCDQLASPATQEECRDGVFMQRAGPEMEHGHSHGATSPLSSLRCAQEPVRYRRACWHYEGRRFVEPAGYGKAFAKCNAAGEYVSVCYWGLGKWIAGQVRSAQGTNQDIIALCSQGPSGRLGDCLAGAAETLVDENWTTEPGERFCRESPESGQAACYAKLRERSAILRSVQNIP
jgi:hypothetical protein